MEALLSGLKAIAEVSRIRILFVLSHGELNVSELTFVLGQSQPRVSRHLKVLLEADLIARHKEGNWVLFRLREKGIGGALARAIVDMLPGTERLLRNDIEKLEEIRRQRAGVAAQYFADNAANWEKLRAYHIDEADVESAICRVAGTARIETLIDLGTGTGRMLEVFAAKADNLIGFDQSREMLAIARSAISNRNLKNAQVRQGDIYALAIPDMTADLVLFHQVLHFLDNPLEAIQEAKRILKPAGRLLIVDFAPHDLEELQSGHAHRRLGISAEQMTDWLDQSGLETVTHHVLPPPRLKSGKGLTVSIWLAEIIGDQERQPTSRKRLHA